MEGKLCQDRLQVGRVKGWITLPKESRLTAAVPHWKRCLILPDAWNDYVIAQIPPDTRKILNDIDSGMCMSSEHFGQLAWQFKRVSGSSGLKVQAAIAC